MRTVARFVALGLAVCVAVIPGTRGLHADEVILEPSQDNTLFEGGGDQASNGAGVSLFAGYTGSNAGTVRRRAVLAFDITNAIPSGVVITSVVLRLTVLSSGPGVGNQPMTVHELFSDWGEGTSDAGEFGGAGVTATPGDATWVHTFFDGSFWLNAGGDFSPAGNDSQIVGTSGFVMWSSEEMVTTVQNWLDQPAGNFGWLIRGNELTFPTAKRFGSRENLTAANRPRLTVGYTIPPPSVPVAIRKITVTNDVQLTWDSNSTERYDVVYSRNLKDENGWLLAEANLPSSPTGTNIWRDPPYLASRSYARNTNLFFGISVLEASEPALPLDWDIVAEDLTSPTVLTHAGDGSDRLFVAEQTGQILVIDSFGDVLPEPFLDLSATIAQLAPFSSTNFGLNPGYDERGLLGLAFHPDYDVNGRFFVYYSSPKTAPGVDHESILAEYTVSVDDENVADPSIEKILLRVDEPEFNHNGGALAFGPDGYLYVALGDGGGAGDVHGTYGNGQNINTLLGKVLRLDVDLLVDIDPPYEIPPDNPFIGVIPGRDEIYAYGFRNPWKMSFDQGGSNELWVADVGQNIWEEINLVHKGRNYGWRILEGNRAFDPSVAATVGVDIATLDFPIHDYKHGPLGISIIGGFVYRGADYPDLAGNYIFGDFSTSFGAPDGALYYLAETRPDIWQRFEFKLPGNVRIGRFVKGFGEDELGSVYLLSSTTLGPSGTTADIRKLRAP